jgi:transposase-like protein
MPQSGQSRARDRRRGPPAGTAASCRQPLSTNAGGLPLRVPKLRTGGLLPSLLDSRRMDQALFAVVRLGGLSARRQHP